MEIVINNGTTSQREDKGTKVNYMYIFGVWLWNRGGSSLTLHIHMVNSKALALFSYSWEIPRCRISPSSAGSPQTTVPFPPTYRAGSPTRRSTRCQLPRWQRNGHHPLPSPTDPAAVVKTSTLETWEAQMEEQGSPRKRETGLPSNTQMSQNILQSPVGKQVPGSAQTHQAKSGCVQHTRISGWQREGNPGGKHTKRTTTLSWQHLRYRVQSSADREL